MLVSGPFVPRKNNIKRTNEKERTKFVLNMVDLLAILQKSLDQAIFIYISIREIRLNGVRGTTLTFFANMT